MTGKEIIADLKAEGIEAPQIKDALCDGAFLKDLGFTEAEVEEAYNLICEEIQSDDVESRR